MTDTAIFKPLEKLQSLGRFVAFSHTIFALPFAVGAGLVCTRDIPVTASQALWIVICLVSARTAAMAFNRIADRKWDALNPRTVNRGLPSGEIKLSEALALLSLSTNFFLFGSWMLGYHCFLVSPFVLLVLFGYSLAKRFTGASHFILGLALACAPGGVWYALTGEFALVALPLMGAVLFWVAGFDIIYSCQDQEFDRSVGLFSIPARCGVVSALWVARIAHLISFSLLLTFGFVAHLSLIYNVCIVFFGLFLVRQHVLVRQNTIERANSVFFTQNGMASMTFLLATFLERLL